MSQPEKPKKYVSMRSEWLYAYSPGCDIIKSASARILKDRMIKNKGIFFKLVNRITFPIIGGSMSGKYSAMVSPMNPIAILWIARS